MSLFGSIFKGVTGAIGGLISSGGNPLGAISGGLSGIGILKGKTAPPAVVMPGGGPMVLPAALPGKTLGTALKNFAPQQGPGGSGVQIQLPSIGPGGVNLGSLTAGKNLGGTYTPPNPQGILPFGGQQQKRRRMDPLNPSALRRAMRRLESFKRATTVADRIEIKKKCRRR